MGDKIYQTGRTSVVLVDGSSGRRGRVGLERPVTEYDYSGTDAQELLRRLSGLGTGVNFSAVVHHNGTAPDPKNLNTLCSVDRQST